MNLIDTRLMKIFQVSDYQHIGIDNAIKEQYYHLELADIISHDDERILSKTQFQYFLDKENITEN